MCPAGSVFALAVVGIPILDDGQRLIRERAFLRIIHMDMSYAGSLPELHR